MEGELPVVGWRQWVVERSGTYERRAKLVEIIECEKCGGRVELWQETEAWTDADVPGHKKHAEYGDVHGFCESCPTAYHDGYDCMYVLDLSSQV